MNPTKDGSSSPWFSPVLKAARFIGGAAVNTSVVLRGLYQGIAPEARAHMAEGALLGLTHVTPARLSRRHHKGRARPVLFVHGLGGDPRNFLPMRTFLSKVGHGRSELVRFPDKRNLEVMVRLLQWRILEVAEAYAPGEERTIDIVAHSMGGLISRLALADESVARRVANLITMGTPHSGTGLARFLNTPKVGELQPGSDTIHTLASQLPWASNPALPRLTCLWSPSDLLLLPPESASVVGAQNIECRGYTHLSFLLKPEGWVIVRDVLAQGVPKANLGAGAP